MVLPMMYIRKSDSRGKADFGWLKSRHTFSFGQYRDPAFDGFSALRVINDDRVAPGEGFGSHGHANMEIISYVLTGALEHKDSMGNGSIIHPGEVQKLSAGSGITHSEFNASKTEPVHFLQMWVIPDKEDVEPSYAQTDFNPALAAQNFVLAASSDGRDQSIAIHQNANLYLSRLPKQAGVLELASGRQQWVHLARGSVKLNGKALSEGDGAAIRGERSLSFDEAEAAELVVFDLPDI